MKYILKIFNRLKEWFALLSVFKQLLVVFLIASVIILISGLLVGSVKESYEIFIDPTVWPTINGAFLKITFAFILAVLGIVITGFIISVLSSFLEGTLSDIKEGNLNYIGYDHILIINYNKKIYKLLQELNIYYKDSAKKEIVIFVDNLAHLKKLQTDISEMDLDKLKIFLRYGNTYIFKRYEELSVFNVYAVIILLDETKKEFETDNKNLKIINMLCTYKNGKFLEYLKYKKNIDKPVKFVSEFYDVKTFEKSLKILSSGLVLPVAPKKIINYILNLSIIDINFYNIWSELLSFEGYEFFFEPSKKYINKPVKFKELVVGFKNAQVIGLSKKSGSDYKIIINEKEEIVDPDNGELGDYIVLLRNKSKEPYFKETQLVSPLNIIDQPSEIFVRNVLVSGNDKNIDLNEFLDLKKSKVNKVVPSEKELFEKSFFDTILQNTDICVMNLDDELAYRVGVALISFYPEKEILNKFVFLINDSFIYELLKNSGYKNIILSDLLIAKYISRIANQMSLFYVLNELLSKKGSEINFIDINDIPESSKENIERLKTDLIESEIIYLGIIKKDNSVEFLSESLEEAEKIIVISKGNIV